MKVTLEDIQAARKKIEKLISPTTCEFSQSCSHIVNSEVFLKQENYQRTGSFKMRGAANKILSLTEAEKKQGVIACSAGNHAQGVALSASLSGVKSVIVMPETASLSKIEATKAYGAEVILHGQIFDEAKEHAFKLAKEKGYVFVHPYEDESVIAGQGTIGLEILEQVSEIDSIIVPIGGGGLISGIAIAAKSLKPSIKIIGVQAAAVDTMVQLFEKKTFTLPQHSVATIADGIAIKNPSQVMFDSFIKNYVDEVVTVTESQIAEAIVFLLERAKTVAEGSGAVAVAALLSHKNLKLGKKTCAVVTGGNIDLNIVSQVIQRGQIQRGRLCELSLIVPDVPGSLSRLTSVLAEHRANVLEVHHDRIRNGLGLKETRIEFVIETTSRQHIETIRQALIKVGAQILN